MVLNARNALCLSYEIDFSCCESVKCAVETFAFVSSKTTLPWQFMSDW